jgi:thiamine-phosphate pyrophosphorylase
VVKAINRVNLVRTLRLYLVTDEASLRGRTLIDVVIAAARGGVTCVQLREKTLCTRDFVAKALALKKALAPFGIPLVINDRMDVALACEAEGVHLGQSDMPPDIARRMLPDNIFIGWSVETVEHLAQSKALEDAGCVDYLGVSPVFFTATKTDIAKPWGLDGMRQARQASTLPLVAIGGVNASNAAELLAAGADGLAVVSAICSAADPTLAACELCHAMDATR